MMSRQMMRVAADDVLFLTRQIPFFVEFVLHLFAREFQAMRKMRSVCQLCCLTFVAAFAAHSTASASVMSYDVTDDTYIDACYTTKNFGAYGGTKVFINKSATGQTVAGEPARALIDLPDTLVSALGGISTGDLVSVKLMLCDYGSQTPGTRAFSLHPLTRSFVEGTGPKAGNVGSGASWETCDGSNAWTTAGGDYDGTHHIDVYRDYSDESSYPWYAFDITSMLNDPADPNGTRNNLLAHGLLIKIDESNPSGTYGHNFASSDNDTSSYRSYFEITTVPEPSVFAMMAPGLVAALGGAALRRNRGRQLQTM